MGAVSHVRVDKDSTDGLPDLSRFGGGYLDDWGSSFLIKKDDEGRLMLSMEYLGGCLHENACGGWQNDTELKAIQDKTFNGAVMQWGTDNDRSIQYHFHNNELIGIGHAGILIWSKDKFDTIEQYLELCFSYDEYFFDGGYSDPITSLATEEDKKAFPLQREETTGGYTGEPLNITFTEKTGKPLAKFMEDWAKQHLPNAT